MSFPSVVTLTGREYYKAEDIRAFHPTYFVGCSDSLSKIIKRKDIPADSYTRRTYVKKTNTWNTCSEKAILLNFKNNS